MIRLADYVAKFVADSGVDTVFMITGGGAMHLNDAFGLESRLHCIFNHHEQACAMAAEGYARVMGKPAVVCITSGPGGTNTLTGVLGQWLDSIPAVYISGQVRFDKTVRSTSLSLRQLGDQESNIVEIVKPITKFSEMVMDPTRIRSSLEKAIHIAKTGRPGPVWLDIPLDVQAAMIDESSLVGYNLKVEEPSNDKKLEEQVSILINRIKSSKRPLILAGAGIRIANAVDEFRNLARLLRVPVQVAWDAIDIFPSDDQLYAGRPSTVGQRSANIIFQNSDLLLAIGCRLNLRQIGYEKDALLREAYIVSVDIDPNELKKPTLDIDLPICADAKDFIAEFARQIAGHDFPEVIEWKKWCKNELLKFPAYAQKSTPKVGVDPYFFSLKLSKRFDENEIIVSSNGASCVIPIQVMEMKHNQRHIVNSGCASMGYGLPAAIGASFANGQRRVICLEGDGSLQMNIQELETLAYHQLPVKVFIFNNDGYLSIRTTQENYFNGHYVGEGTRSGVGFPDFVKVAQAYGISASRIKTNRSLEKQIQKILAAEGPYVCEVVMDPGQKFEPRVSSKRMPNGKMVSSPFEDMFPFLLDEELKENMLIPLWNPEKRG